MRLFSPAHCPRSRFWIAAAISSGNLSGVQAKLGTPIVASAAAFLLVEARGAVVRKGQERDDSHARPGERGGAPEHLLVVPALKEIGE